MMPTIDEQTERQQAIEALQHVMTISGVNITGTGCSVHTAEHAIDELEKRGFTIVRKCEQYA